ncbi:asparagine synthase (glutamine-hydrolyzing) [Rhodospirillaceae bacterium KN72]|uniref:asparagine synthase (glutamine-hydrolyzing) n=1 Tax=Pacificispira spongiicola TaxID=2729598 RepID=A0A7Y0E255_9PROT|nr:asparagine synthase (glutamine-hydrolyzing) [Pacificispira spongiicola]NMM45859.1 asparagine synthase (glutamine-hydrolyzing) [Pacificispira spongiicola]
MCGIAGIMTRDGSTPTDGLLDRLMQGLTHRGPDGSGRHLSGDVGLVQTRLAIIDLTTGDQPLYEPAGGALVANGEIYNYVELRAEMADTPFRTQSDCETALFLYRRDGVRYADRLRGMYAIAIHDPMDGGSLILSRDPFGIKPLYYIETPDCFAFASEPGVLLNAGLHGRKLDEASRDEFLQLQFSCGRTLPVAGVQRVLPGETLVIRQGRIVARYRREALPAGGVEKLSEADALARLDTALHDSVTVHQRSDVPYGLFLSGGIDSSVLLSLMAELNDQPVIAFTAGFDGAGVHDERDHARMLATKLGARHEEVSFGEKDFHALLPSIASAVDDPTADYAVLPSWALAERAAQDLKVILCGEGGDELFAGYGRYRSVLRPWWLGGKSMRSRGVFDRLGVLRNESRDWRDSIYGREARAGQDQRNRLQTAQAVDCEDWLPNDLLVKLDRCLMAHGLEGRTPFLDPAVAEAAFRLPDNLKIRDGKGKYLLRRWLENRLPEAKPFSPKRGFTVPVGHWIAADGDRLGAAVAAQDSIQAIAHPDRVRGLFRAAEKKREGQAAWLLLFYALWHKSVIAGQDIRGASILDALDGTGTGA